MTVEFNWHFTPGQRRHTQDGTNLVRLMKGIGHGRKPVLAVDVGCGDGIIAHDILALKKATKIIALDISPEVIQSAEKNLESEIQRGRAQVFCRSAQSFFRNRENWDRFDRFVINPPFFSENSGFENKNKRDRRARHDGTLPLHTWALGAKRLLKTGGELYCVFPTERLAEVISALSRNQVEPKEIWWLKKYVRNHRFFLRAVRGARPGLRMHLGHTLLSNPTS